MERNAGSVIGESKIRGIAKVAKQAPVNRGQSGSSTEQHLLQEEEQLQPTTAVNILLR